MLSFANLKHKWCVNNLAIFNNKLYSGSGSVIYIWNTDTYEKIATLIGSSSVECIIIFDNTIYSGNWDGTIRVWAGTPTETYEEIATLRGHNNCVRCLILHEDKLFSGSMDKTIRIWKV